MKKGLFFVGLLMVLLSVACSGDKFIRRKIKQKDITVLWYYHSLITNNTPEMVVVRSGFKEQEVFKSRAIVDVWVEGKSLVVKLNGSQGDFENYWATPDSVFGYKVIIDSTGTSEDWKRMPNYFTD